MKKLVRVSLFVLMALTLSLAIGCKHDSDPEPAPADVAGKNDPASANFVGEWVDESEGIPYTIKADGTLVMQSDGKIEGKYHVSPDGKIATVTITYKGKEETLTLTSKSEDTLELTLPEDFGGGTVTLTKRVDADFAGQWKSTDGSATATLKDGKFTTTVGGHKLEEAYTVVGKTATTPKMKIPAELAGGSEVSVSFIMKMVDGNDVMALTVPAELTQNEPFDMTFVKMSSTKPDLTGTWTGKVVIDEKGTLGDATIVFANNKANLTLPGQTEPVTATVTQDGNFFTITLEDEQKSYELTGLISASGKVWLDDGSVFTKQQ